MQLDAVIDLFMPDAQWDPGPGGPPFMNNRDEIREFYKELFEASNNLYHLTSNHIINVNGDTATGTAYYMASGVTSNGDSFGANGYYSDNYVRHVRRLEVPTTSGHLPARSRLRQPPVVHPGNHCTRLHFPVQFLALTEFL